MMVRTATPDDANKIARVHVEAWRVAYRGIIADSVLDGLSIEKRESQWREWIEAPPGPIEIFVSDDVKGFISIGPSRDQGATSSTQEIYAIYIDPARWLTGLGRALTEHAIESARKRGAKRITLWVLEANRAARSFYERMGFSLDGEKKIDRIGDADLVELRYARTL